MQVSIHQLQKTVLKKRTILKNFIPSIFLKEGRKLESLNIIFCSDDYLLEINRTYLNHDYLTDIITFDLSEQQSLIIGELYISVERVKENASQFSKSFSEELLRVIFHGALHLCGFKDKTSKDQSIMRLKEEEYLAAFKSINP